MNIICSTIIIQLEFIGMFGMAAEMKFQRCNFGCSLLAHWSYLRKFAIYPFDQLNKFLFFAQSFAPSLSPVPHFLLSSKPDFPIVSTNLISFEVSWQYSAAACQIRFDFGLFLSKTNQKPSCSYDSLYWMWFVFYTIPNLLEFGSFHILFVELMICFDYETIKLTSCLSEFKFKEKSGTSIIINRNTPDTRLQNCIALKLHYSHKRNTFKLNLEIIILCQ